MVHQEEAISSIRIFFQEKPFLDEKKEMDACENLAKEDICSILGE